MTELLGDGERAREVIKQGTAAKKPRSTTGEYQATLRNTLFGRALAPSEKKTLLLIAQGKSMAEAAAVKVVQEDTIRSQLRNVYAKLGAINKAHAVALAVKNGELDVKSVRPKKPKELR